MSVILIRHAKTQGNLEVRYIGRRTDEALCDAGVMELKRHVYPRADILYVSPMKRCLETAAIVYPNLKPVIVDDFAECDFGAFEGKNYAELNGRADYQAWIDSGGEMRFPGGESRAEMCTRCIRAYERLNIEAERFTAAVIAHGGTLMALMSEFALPKENYFSYQPKNCEGFILNGDGSWKKLFD